MTTSLTVAAFDFDGTLTTRDTLVPFLLAAVGRRRFLSRSAPLIPAGIGYALGRVCDESIVPRLFARVLRGVRRSELELTATAFAQAHVPRVLRPDATARLAWHLRQGHCCVVVTASPEIYVARWARHAGVADVLGSRLAIGAGGRLTGRLDGARCAGVEKVRRLREHLGDRSGYVLHAYGDSRSDAALLGAADHAYYRTFDVPNWRPGGVLP
jgi:phosphatidylglycerophosphatase C